MKSKCIKLTKHHRKPRSIGGADKTDNISLVSESSHQAWHTLFGNKTAPEIALIINAKWLDPDYMFMCFPVKNP